MNEYDAAYEKIIEEIKSKRKEKKINQKALADLIGVTQTTYSQIEARKVMLTVPRLFAICDYLDIDIINKKHGQLVSVDSNKLIEIIAKQGEDIEEIKNILKKSKD